MREEKAKKIVYECYRKIYKLATPSADFDELMKNSPKDSKGKPVIPFLDYEIEEEVEQKIIKDVGKKYCLSKLEKSQLNFTIILGVSPIYLVKYSGHW